MYLALLVAALAFFFTAPNYYPTFWAAIRTMGFGLFAAFCGFIGALTA